ncbi:MAG: Gfo/Idh/MocA family oxidoreductase [Actinobacteria bacterium]|nr:Gfo/Idh/MocA family oxidoreductase [Actinomycetota bacterium]
MTHRPLGIAADEPVRVVLAGAGAMGRAWLQVISVEPGVELAGVADVNLGVARDAVAQAVARGGSPAVPVGGDVVVLARETAAHAVVDVTVPSAHHPVTTAALLAGLPVLGEKPAAATLAEALSLCAAAEVTGELFMVSQSRRWNPRLAAFGEAARALGPVATLTTQFFKAAHFGGFREEMADPLLVDMAIHAFDSARFLLRSEPATVYCEAWNPPWSWFSGNAAASATFAMDDGARYVYDGSWFAPGAETSWNGAWRAVAEHGTVCWDGEAAPVAFTEPDHAGRRYVDGPADPAGGRPVPVADGPEGIAGALRAFVAAVRSGRTPDGEVHGNVMSLAMVEAAVRSAATGRWVLLDDVLEDAHRAAVRSEPHAGVRAALRAWPDPRSGLADAATTA